MNRFFQLCKQAKGIIIYNLVVAIKSKKYATKIFEKTWWGGGGGVQEGTKFKGVG